MNIFQKIKAPTPPKEKRKGQVLTVLSGLSFGIANSGLVEQRPLIKEGLNILGGFLANAALNKAAKVQR